MPTAVVAALAPVVAQGAGLLVGHKQKQSAEKKQAAYEQQQAAQQEAGRKTAWEAEQASPEAAMRRQSFTMRLGRLLGAAGGREKLPPSLLAGYEAGRKMPTYTPGASYIPKPTSGAGIWDVLGGATNALSYLDTSKLKGSPKVPTATGFGEGSSFGAAPQFQTGQVGKLLGGQIKRMPWEPQS